MAYDKVAYNQQYNKDSYDVIRAYVPKGRRAAVKAAAERRGVSVSTLVTHALESYCKELDLTGGA